LALKHEDYRLGSLHLIHGREFEFFSHMVPRTTQFFSPTVNGSLYRVVKAARVSN
jgi:hypothetical protein